MKTGYTVSLQMHLQTVHKTDRLYMCETCDYVASDKAGIMSHLPTHLETSTSANDLLSCNASSVTQPSTSNITVIYTCAECGFESQTLQILRTHALKHNAGASPLDGQEESSTTEVDADFCYSYILLLGFYQTGWEPVLLPSI